MEHDINTESGIETFPYKVSEDSEDWCDSYLVSLVYEEIIATRLTLSQVKAHPYLKIFALESVPDFCIKTSDLSPKVVKGLMGYDREERAVVLKQAVARIFEDINARLYHERISKVLRVRLIL